MAKKYPDELFKPYKVLVKVGMNIGTEREYLFDKPGDIITYSRVKKLIGTGNYTLEDFEEVKDGN